MRCNQLSSYPLGKPMDPKPLPVQDNLLFDLVSLEFYLTFILTSFHAMIVCSN
jgi:hypothetical protein